MPNRYQDRHAAGKVLAAALQEYAERPATQVLALPRGGVPVAYEIAQSLHLPLDVFIVRKLGVPGHEELAFGALAEGETKVFNDEIIRSFALSKESIARVIAAEQSELSRRVQLYRAGLPSLALKGFNIILVDDGMATGATMRAAVLTLKKMAVAKIIIAIPVADRDVVNDFKPLVDKIVCPIITTDLRAVGAWYDQFDQTEDAEVQQCLQQRVRNKDLT